MGSEQGGTTFDQAARSTPSGSRHGLPLPALTLLSHPDLSRVGDRAFLGELTRGRDVLLARMQPHFAAPGATVGEPLGDPFLSRRPLRLVPLAGGGVRLQREDNPSVVAVDGLSLDEGVDLTAADLDAGVVLEVAERIVLLLHRRPPPGPPPPERFGLVGESARMDEVRQAVARVAALDTTVLLRGESGTGKELVARALHEHGTRAGRPFLGVNLAALPQSLAAAELFGATRGSYTGAVRDTPGFFSRADGGTLFFDEIGEAPLEVQVLLLRALETGEVVPVGAQTPHRVDVRIVSATDADLEGAIQNGSFRSALLHRLAGYSIRLPALRDRREDIGRLLVFFLGRELERLGERLPRGDAACPEPWLPASLVARLARYDWPGNVRQLQNVARQLAIDGRGQPVLKAGPGLQDLLPERAARQAATAPSQETVPELPQPAISRRRRPSEVSDDELHDALRTHRWNLKDAAEALGIARTSLYVLLDRSPRIRPASEVPPEEIRRAHERCGGDVEAMAAELEVSQRALRQRLKDLGLR